MHIVRLGAMLAVSAAALALVLGCGRPQWAAQVGVPAQPGELAAAEAAYNQLTSFKVTLTEEHGDVLHTNYVKLKGGRPIKEKIVDRHQCTLLDYGQMLIYDYDAQDKSAKVRSGRRWMAGPNSQFEELRRGRPKVSDSRLGRMPCLVTEMPDPAGGTQRMWIDKQYGLLRQRMDLPGSPSDSYVIVMKMKCELINAVPDSEFELPPGTKIVPGKPAAGG